MSSLINDVTCGDAKRMVKPVALTVVADVVELAPFVCAALIVERVLALVAGQAVESGDFYLLCAVMAALAVASFVLERAALSSSFVDGYAASAQSRVRLAGHIRTLPLGYLDARGQASLVNSLMNDIALTEHGMSHVLPQTVAGIAVALIGTVVLACVDWRYALAAFVGLPVAVAVVACGRGLRARRERALNEARIAQRAALQDILYGIAEVKSCAGAPTVIERARCACRSYADACVGIERTVGSLNALAQAALKIGLPALLVAGAFLIDAPGFSAVTFVLFLMVGTRMFDPLAAAIVSWAELETSAAAGARVNRVLAERPLSGDGQAPEAGRISFEGVTFAYPGADSPALRDATTAFESGEVTALVGPSGSGKSTMLRLAARFYDPDAGSVRFGAVDESTCDPEALFSRMAMVFQDVYVFRGTIEENIRYGREGATREEVVAAARAARCHEFIERLPQGYATPVGEGGSTLSGGERQRIAIARALLKDAPVVLLDEATSALDPLNERAVQEALDALVEGRTVVMVAHRLKTASAADRIVVLDRGEVVEEGTHDALMATHGLYAHLYELQEHSDAWRIA